MWNYSYLFFPTIHLCNYEQRDWQKTIHPVELVICDVTFKCPLQKCALPGNLKQVSQVSIYVSPKPEMSLKKHSFLMKISICKVKIQSIPCKSHTGCQIRHIKPWKLNALKRLVFLKLRKKDLSVKFDVGGIHKRHCFCM